MKSIFNFAVGALFIISYIVMGVIFGSGQIITKTVSASSTARVKSEQQIKADFNQLAGVIDATAASRRTTGLSNTGKPLPGDQPVFLLKSSHEFIRRGETLNLSLVSMVNRSTPLYIYGQIQKPGETGGEFDGTQPVRYYQADNNNHGFVNELRPFSEIKLLSRLFTGEDSLGRHTFNVVVVDTAGRLVQQLIVDIYLVNAGQYGRHYYVQSAQPMTNEFMMTGRFPTNIPIYYIVGAPDAGSIMTGPDPQSAAYSDGTNVVVWGAGMEFPRTTSLDVFMWSPGSRYAIVKPHVWAQDSPPQ